MVGEASVDGRIVEAWTHQVRSTKPPRSVPAQFGDPVADLGQVVCETVQLHRPHWLETAVVDAVYGDLVAVPGDHFDQPRLLLDELPDNEEHPPDTPSAERTEEVKCRRVEVVVGRGMIHAMDAFEIDGEDGSDGHRAACLPGRRIMAERDGRGSMLAMDRVGECQPAPRPNLKGSVRPCGNLGAPCRPCGP